ncbi:MAG: sulfotransferase [Sedimentitalea sp.]
MSTSKNKSGRGPDFYCIGAQKAGTTWLHENLRRHPGVWMPPVKELQYFNQIHIPEHANWTQEHRDSHVARSIRWHVTNNDELNLRHLRLLTRITKPRVSDAWYKSIFTAAPAQSLCGEMTPEYSLMPDQGIQHLLSISPDARVLFVMRDPIDRCWSHLRMLIKRNQDHAGDMSQIVKMNDVYDRADYVAIKQRWQAHVPADRLMFCDFDDIKKQPVELLKQIIGFLGLEADSSFFPKAEQVVHEGRKMDIPADVYDYMKNRLAPVYDRLLDHMPDVARPWHARHYISA